MERLPTYVRTLIPKEARGDIQILCRLRSCLLVHRNIFELRHIIGPGITPNWLICTQDQGLRDADPETLIYSLLCQQLLQESVHSLIRAKVNPTHELAILAAERALTHEIAKIARLSRKNTGDQNTASGLSIRRAFLYAAAGAGIGAYLARRCDSPGD